MKEGSTSRRSAFSRWAAIQVEYTKKNGTPIAAHNGRTLAAMANALPIPRGFIVPLR